MKIEDAIQMLVEAKNNGTKNIILAYWESDIFQKNDDGEWAEIAEQVEDQMDWSITNDGIESLIESLQ